MSSSSMTYQEQLLAQHERLKSAFEARRSAQAAAAAKASSDWQKQVVCQLLFLVWFVWMSYRWLQRRVVRKEYEESLRLQPPIYELHPHCHPCEEPKPWYIGLRGWLLSTDISPSEQSSKGLGNAASSATKTFLALANDLRRNYEAVRFNTTTDAIVYEYQQLTHWLGNNKPLFFAGLLALWYISRIVEREDERGSLRYVDWTEVTEADGFVVPQMFWQHRARHLMQNGAIA